MSSLEDHLHSNIIQETRNLVQNMNEQQRFEKAKRHLFDAIYIRHPRNNFEINKSNLFKICYLVQTSSIWDFILFMLSFLYMYLIVGEPTNRRHTNESIKIPILTMEVIILVLYWMDIAMEIFHKWSWKASINTKYPILFRVKTTLIGMMTVDCIIYYPLYYIYPVRIFRICRPCLPFLFNKFARKAIQSLISIYRDIICYTVFYFTIIFTFGIFATQLINLPPGTQFDFYKSNYDNVGQTSFLLYILASFDSWPDYWQLAVDQSKWYYVFLVAFIFLNFFYFVTIPTTVMFNSFKKTRSALMLIDDIHQQNSLLLCFICLGQDNLCIKSQTFHQFMLYAYRSKLRLIDHIKQFSFRLGGHHNAQIFISDFMKICKIIQQEPQMCPPNFDDWQPYIRFRKFLKQKLYLKIIITSLAYSIFAIVMTLLNIIVLIVSPFEQKLNNSAIQYFFVISFEVEVLMRVFGLGVEKYFNQVGNILQFILAFLYVVLLSLTGTIDKAVMIQLFSVLRLFRIPRVLNILLINEYFKRFYYKNSFFRKLRVIFEDLYVSIIVGVSMFPLFLTLYYILGIIGIQAYDETHLIQQSSPYSFYDEVSNFRTFLLSQVVIVQCMVQAGWSLIIFDHAYRFGHTALVYIYFITIHIFIDTTIFSIMKGMVADLYESISMSFQALNKLEQQEMQNQKLQKDKKDEIAQIRKILEQGTSLGYDSLKKKEIYQNKLDRQMMENLKSALNKKQIKSFRRLKNLRSVIFARSAGQIFKKRQDIKTQPKLDSQKQTRINNKAIRKNSARISINVNESNSNSNQPSNKQIQQKHVVKHTKVKIEEDQNVYISSSPMTQEKLQISKGEDEELDPSSDSSSISIGDSDIQQIEDNLLDRIILKEEQIPYAQAPVYPKFLLQFLGKKMIIARDRIQKQGPFNPNIMGIRSESALSFYTNILEALLDIKKPQNERKQQIAEAILALRMPNSDISQINKILSKKQQVDKKILIRPIVRKIMLNNTSEEFIKKFQIEYFSSVYGNSFRQINRSTLDPLLRHQSLMLYNFHRILRYPPPDIEIFWNMLASIQDNVSRTLLHNGSIFTFVFEVQELAGNWFAIEVRQNMQIKIHFLKTGIWIYNRSLKFNQVYYAQDIFHCDQQQLASNQNSQKTIKLLYNAFQTLGFSMLNQTNFFDSDPARHSYDLFTFALNCQRTQRIKQQKSISINTDSSSKSEQHKNYNLKITKMMCIVLSREYERPPGKQLKYQLTNLKKILEQQLDKRKEKAFKFDEDENKTYEKLESLAEDEYQRLIDSQSLEYAFILDAVQSIKDTCSCYLDNFIMQAETVLNRQFSKVQAKQ